MSTNDNHSVLPGEALQPCAHGLAALLLVESLIHGLCEKTVLSASEATEIAERAADVQLERAQVADADAAALWRSHALLRSIAVSLRIDD